MTSNPPSRFLALPPVMQPRGSAYFIGTWSGRILTINFIIFLIMAQKSGALFMPTDDVLFSFGIKDPVALAEGEYWRLITPMFVHIGLIHFAINSLAIYFIGYQLETLLGGKWFVSLYLLSGIMGNIASAVFIAVPSAGASGAIFGLAGSGFLLERLVGKKIEEATGRRPRKSIYTSIVVLNVILGLVIPGIDNGAHIGGLLTGILLTFIMIQLRPNRLQVRRKHLGYLGIVFIVLLGSFGSFLATSPSYMANLLETAGDKHEDEARSLSLYSRSLKIEPDDMGVRLKRGRILVLLGFPREGFADLRLAAQDKTLKSDLLVLADEFEKEKLTDEAWQVRRLLEGI